MTMTQTPEDAAELEAVNAELQRIIQHQNAGRVAEAGAMIDRLLETYADHPRLLHLKGLNLIREGKRDAGIALLKTVLAFERNDVSALVDYGTILAEGGDLEEATKQFRAAVEIAPNYALAHANLGAALVLDKQLGPAITHLEKAMELDGKVMDVHTNLAQAYLRTNRFDRAIEVLYKALALDPQSVAAHVGLAGALFRRERHEAAEHHARRAIELAPDAVEAWMHLGNTLGAAGRMDEAAAALLKIARHPAVGVTALGRLAHMRKTTADSPELALLEQYVAQIDKLNPEQQATIHFAMGKAMDDLKDYDRAMDHLGQANAITAELHPYDRSVHRQRAERIRDLVTPALITRCGGGGVAGVAPIFICGLPRSGTTLMDQMFSRHPEVQAGGELTAVPMALGRNKRLRDMLEQELAPEAMEADDLTRLGEDYIAFLHGEGLKAAHVTDKLPGNYMYVGLLAMALPGARFLIMRRHPMDCLFSNYMQNFGQNQPFSTEFANLAAAYDQFDLMAKHWSALLPDRVREVHYEEVVADPEARMRGIMEFAGLDWSDAVLDHTASTRQVNTASVAQVRQPIYRSSVARWRRYGPLLQGLAGELRQHLTAEELQACGVAPTP